MFNLLFIQLLASSHGLKVAVQAPAQCPDIVNQTENILFWGLLLDGKDHAQGRNAYNWHGFKDAYKALNFILSTSPDEPLNWNKIMAARKIVAASQPAAENFGWAGMRKGAYERNILGVYTCLNCEHMKALLADVPANYWDIKMGNNTRLARVESGACPDYKDVRLRPKPNPEIKELFQNLIKDYNADMEKLTDKSEQLTRLTSFLKDFAMLHPWGNGNGRFRTLMLNHEVRRLGLGCGAMMYNNNKDLYYITKTVYREKIEEGIAMYDKAISSGNSPWLDEQEVATHKKRFDPDITMPGLTSCRKMEPKAAIGPRGSYWLEKDMTESELASDWNLDQ